MGACSHTPGAPGLPCGSPMAAGRSGPDAYNHPAGKRIPRHILAGRGYNKMASHGAGLVTALLRGGSLRKASHDVLW